MSQDCRIMKPFYSSSSPAIVEARHTRIADLFRAESLRVFRLPAKPALVSEVQLGMIGFVGSCPNVSSTHPTSNGLCSAVSDSVERFVESFSYCLIVLLLFLYFIYLLND